MKKFLIAAAVTLLILPSSAFALVNIDVYGGYSMGESILDLGDSESKTGPGFGARAHYYGGFAVIGYGAGAFIQYSPLSYEQSVAGKNVSTDFERTSYGLDFFLVANIPAIPLHPYVRGGSAVYDKVATEYTFDGNSFISSSDEYFGLYYGGIGMGLTILPLPVISVQLFAEYLYEYAKNSKNNRFNLGISGRI